MKKITISINSEALKNELAKRNLTLKNASSEMGYSDSFMQGVVKKREINVPAMKMLEMMYNIKPEIYILQEETEPEQMVFEEIHESEGIAFDFDKLHEIIYNAVYTAVKRAWQDD